MAEKTIKRSEAWKEWKDSLNYTGLLEELHLKRKGFVKSGLVMFERRTYGALILVNNSPAVILYKWDSRDVRRLKSDSVFKAVQAFLGE